MESQPLRLPRYSRKVGGLSLFDYSSAPASCSSPQPAAHPLTRLAPRSLRSFSRGASSAPRSSSLVLAYSFFSLSITQQQLHQSIIPIRSARKKGSTSPIPRSRVPSACCFKLQLCQFRAAAGG